MDHLHYTCRVNRNDSQLSSNGYESVPKEYVAKTNVCSTVDSPKNITGNHKIVIFSKVHLLIDNDKTSNNNSSDTRNDSNSGQNLENSFAMNYIKNMKEIPEFNYDFLNSIINDEKETDFDEYFNKNNTLSESSQAMDDVPLSTDVLIIQNVRF